MSRRIVPLTVTAANDIVARVHRHHKPVQGGFWAIGLEHEGEVVGAAIVGRPVARRLQDWETCEVLRVAVAEGVPNACSQLLGRVRRVAQMMGYRRVITYTLEEEGGASLRAAGWKCLGRAGGGSWSRPSRGRVDRHPLQRKIRWEAPA